MDPMIAGDYVYTWKDGGKGPYLAFYYGLVIASNEQFFHVHWTDAGAVDIVRQGNSGVLKVPACPACQKADRVELTTESWMCHRCGTAYIPDTKKNS